MGAGEWLGKNWANTSAVSCLIITALIETWQQALSNSPQSSLPRLEGSWHYAPLVLLVVGGAFWVYGRFHKTSTAQPPPAQAIQPVRSLVPGIPTLSALLGTSPQITFDSQRFFRFSYYSPHTAEIENNIKTIAHKDSPDNPEAFYARFIGVGTIAYQHDMTWAYIFGSQLKLVAEASRVNVSVARAKEFYDAATIAFPAIYPNYSFEGWLGYIVNEQLLIKHPSEMLEITERGRDLLKYLAHWGRDINIKRG